MYCVLFSAYFVLRNSWHVLCVVYFYMHDVLCVVVWLLCIVDVVVCVVYCA